MPIFVTVMLALCNACWDLVLSRAAMLIKHVLCLVLPTDTTAPSWPYLCTLKTRTGRQNVIRTSVTLLA